MLPTDLTVASIVRQDDRYLMIEEQASGLTVLTQPGGHIDAGESPELAVVRETLEETGCTVEAEDLIAEEDVVVTLSHEGYAKAQPLDSYQAQRRGGKGRAATRMKDEDFIDKLFVANTHDTLLCFSSRGKAYWLKVYQLPQAGRTARGKPIVNLLPLDEGERINAVLPVREFPEDRFVFMATAQGTVKKTPLADFSRPRANGIIALDLREDDYLVNVAVTDGTRDVMLFSNTGKAIRFKESDVRPMGRTACGVRGTRLAAGQRVIALLSPTATAPARSSRSFWREPSPAARSTAC